MCPCPQYRQTPSWSRLSRQDAREPLTSGAVWWPLLVAALLHHQTSVGIWVLHLQGIDLELWMVHIQFQHHPVLVSELVPLIRHVWRRWRQTLFCILVSVCCVPWSTLDIPWWSHVSSTLTMLCKRVLEEVEVRQQEKNQCTSHMAKPLPRKIYHRWLSWLLSPHPSFATWHFVQLMQEEIQCILLEGNRPPSHASHVVASASALSLWQTHSPKSSHCHDTEAQGIGASRQTTPDELWALPCRPLWNDRKPMRLVDKKRHQKVYLWPLPIAFCQVSSFPLLCLSHPPWSEPEWRRILQWLCTRWKWSRAFCGNLPAGVMACTSPWWSWFLFQQRHCVASDWRLMDQPPIPVLMQHWSIPGLCRSGIQHLGYRSTCCHQNVSTHHSCYLHCVFVEAMSNTFQSICLALRGRTVHHQAP